MSYIWQSADWPHFTYNKDVIDPKADGFEKAYKKTESVFSLLNSSTQNKIITYSISDETLSSSSIEGIHLHYGSIVSSISKRLGLACEKPIDGHAADVASVVYDAVSNPAPITFQRLFEWDAILTRNSSINSFRKGFVGVYSGRAAGREELVYEAPPAEAVPTMTTDLLNWLESSKDAPVIKSAIASFWFVSIHPFGDGNGRISRALADYIMASRGRVHIRFFSMSKAIEKNKNLYYGLLQKLQSQSKSLDLTSWILWYVDLVCDALADAESSFRDVIFLTQSMNSPLLEGLNVRQKDILFRIFSKGFYGNLTSEKYRKIEKCSPAQATRDLSEMEKAGMLDKSESGGRSTSYILKQSFKQRLLNEGNQ